MRLLWLLIVLGLARLRLARLRLARLGRPRIRLTLLTRVLWVPTLRLLVVCWVSGVPVRHQDRLLLDRPKHWLSLLNEGTTHWA